VAIRSWNVIWEFEATGPTPGFPVTHSNTPNEDVSTGEGQRKEIYEHGIGTPRDELKETLSLCSGTGTSFRFK
jgi:hypothetical protein